MIKKIKDWEWTEVEQTSSTNDLAAQFLQEVKRPYLITAKRQTCGRGRRGRSWVSEEGNLFLSLTVQSNMRDLGQLVIMSGLAVCRTVNYFCPQALAEVKWPNDVMVEGAKISGILFESAKEDWWIMGVGINVVSQPSEGMMYDTISLNSLGCKAQRLEVLEHFIEEFDELLKQWKKEGFAEIKKSWLDKAYKHGKKIIIKQERCNKEGIFVSIDDNGNLILLTEEGMEHIIVGDVF